MTRITQEHCQDCGACCIANGMDDHLYVYLSDRDLKRLSQHYRERRTVEDEDGSRYLRTKTAPTGDKVCCALRGSPGNGRVSCTIYEGRPHVCRVFRPGSTECLDARADIAHRLEV